jgi:hypothetical protein
MSQTILYSPSAAGLHLGPGLPTSDEVVNFREGFATIEDDDPLKDKKLSWVAGAVGAYPGLRVVTEAEADAIKAPLTMSDAEFDALAARRAGRR